MVNFLLNAQRHVFRGSFEGSIQLGKNIHFSTYQKVQSSNDAKCLCL